MTVTDSATNAPVCNATVQAKNTRTGAIEQLQGPPLGSTDCEYVGLSDASENETTVWQLIVDAPGFKQAVSSVEVTHDGCHIDGASKTVALEKS